MLKFIRGKGHQPSAERLRLQKLLFKFKKTVQHGFPGKPSSIAYDSSLSLLAIGTKFGAIKIYGKPGVEFYGQHKNGEAAVTQIFFLNNQGRLVTLCDDNSLHLWELNEETEEGTSQGWTLEEIKEVSLEGKLKKISACCLERSGHHLLIGTEGGNIYLLDLKSFEMTEQIIYQDVVLQNVPDDYKVNPGAVEAIAEHPTLEDKILIGYNRGLTVLWDKKETQASKTYVSSQQLESLSWNEDGKRFLSSHNDGSYIEWDADEPSRAGNPTTPYGPFPCKAITRILWKTNESGDLKIFSGGMPRASHGDKNTVTLIQNSKTIALDFTSKVVDFLTIPNSAGSGAGSLLVLVEEELVGIDLEDNAWPQLRLPYLAPLHASPITATHIASNVDADLVKKIREAADKQNEGFSSKAWPVQGGKIIGEPTEEEGTILVTGHEDGTIRMWDAGRVALEPLLTFKGAGNIFLSESEDEIVPIGEEEIPSADQDNQDDESWPMRKIGSFDPFSDDPRLAIKKIWFCPRTGDLIVGGTAGQIIVSKFSEEKINEGKIQATNVNVVNDVDGFVWKGHGALKLKAGALNGTMKLEPGLQTVSVIQVLPPACITALTAHGNWGVVAIGTAHGYTLFDDIAKKPILVKCTLNPHDYAGGAGDAPMSRRKSFKKSLRESFRKLRKGRTSGAAEGPPKKKTTRQGSEEKASPEKKSKEEKSKEKDKIEEESGKEAEKGEEKEKAEPETGKEEAKGEEKPAEPEPGSGSPGGKTDEDKEGDKKEAKEPEESATQAEEAKPAGAEAASPKKEVVEVVETKPVERQIEARSADDTFTGLIRCLSLVECHLLSLNTTTPSFWVGNNGGAIYIYTLSFPPADKRSENPVLFKLAKEIQLKHRAPVMAISILDGNAPLPEYPCAVAPAKPAEPTPTKEPAASPTPAAAAAPAPGPAEEAKDEKEKEKEKDEKKEEKEEEKKPASTPAPTSTPASPAHPTHSKHSATHHVHPKVLICSEEQFKVFSLPNLKPLGKYKITAHEGARIKRVTWGKFKATVPGSGTGGSASNSPSKTESHQHEETCLMCLSNQGDLSVFSVPDLRRQLHAHCIRKEDITGILHLAFTANGEAVYLQSSSELQRLSLAANYAVEAKCGVDLPEGSRPPKEEKKPKAAAGEDANKSEDAEGDKHNTSSGTGNGDVSSNKDKEGHDDSKLETSQMSTDITIDSIKDHLSGLETSITKKTEIKTESISEKIEESITMSKITTISTENTPVPIAGN